MKKDRFDDVYKAMVKVNQKQETWEALFNKLTSQRTKLLRQKQSQKLSISDVIGKKLSTDVSLWELFQMGITNKGLYEEDDPLVKEILESMANLRFEHIEQNTFPL